MELLCCSADTKPQHSHDAFSGSFSWLALSFKLKPWEIWYVVPLPLHVCLKGHGYYVLETYPRGLGSLLEKLSQGTSLSCTYKVKDRVALCAAPWVQERGTLTAQEASSGRVGWMSGQ